MSALQSYEPASAMRLQRMSAKRAAYAAFAEHIQGRLRAVSSRLRAISPSGYCDTSNVCSEPLLTNAACCTNGGIDPFSSALPSVLHVELLNLRSALSNFFDIYAFQRLRARHYLVWPQYASSCKLCAISVSHRLRSKLLVLSDIGKFELTRNASPMR